MTTEIELQAEVSEQTDRGFIFLELHVYGIVGYPVKHDGYNQSTEENHEGDRNLKFYHWPRPPEFEDGQGVSAKNSNDEDYGWEFQTGDMDVGARFTLYLKDHELKHHDDCPIKPLFKQGAKAVGFQKALTKWADFSTLPACTLISRAELKGLFFSYPP